MQTFFETPLSFIKNHSQYQTLMLLPPRQRWTVWIGILLTSLVIFLSVLYLLFGKIVVIGVIASMLAGLATGLGALPAVFLKNISTRVFNSLLGTAAGVMLSATVFSLIIPSMETGHKLWEIAIGLLLGALFVHLADKNLPHLHVEAKEKAQLDSLKKISLFIVAITLHNFPEGMSVGISFGSGDLYQGLVLTIAIALQNIPEGLAVALPLVGLGYNKWKAVGVATLTGLVEPIGGLLGVTMVTVFSLILPFALGFAAGAMLFVITEEIIPETHAKGRSREATFALIGGFILMMMLDDLLS